MHRMLNVENPSCKIVIL